jgi:hypothetical protein
MKFALTSSEVKGCTYLKESRSIFDSAALQSVAVSGHSGKEIFPNLAKELKQMSQVANDYYKEYALFLNPSVILCSLLVRYLKILTSSKIWMTNSN